MRIRIVVFCLSSTLCGSLSLPGSASGQTATVPGGAETPRSGAPSAASTNGLSDLMRDAFKDLLRLPSSDTAALLGIGATAAVMSRDADGTFGSWLSGDGVLDASFETGNVIGGFAMQFGGALATLAVGRLTDRPRISKVGADLFRAHLLSQAVTGAIKISVRRTRPDGTNLSFPSGHTSTSFASATILQHHLGWKAGVPAFAVASYVAAARIQEERHYLSDVVFGAAIGIAAGRTVTVGRGRATFAVAPMALPGGGGVSLTLLNRR